MHGRDENLVERRRVGDSGCVIVVEAREDARRTRGSLGIRNDINVETVRSDEKIAVRKGHELARTSDARNGSTENPAGT